MSGTKIEVVLGPISFSGEGDQAWLSEQLEKVLAAAPGVLGVQQPTTATVTSLAPSSSGALGANSPFTISLSSYIKEKGGESNQVDRFLRSQLIGYVVVATPNSLLPP